MNNIICVSQSKVDYFYSLSPEILLYILNLLDLDDIYNCLLVSKSWDRRIRCSPRWHYACKSFGASKSRWKCSDPEATIGQYHYFELYGKLLELNDKATVKLKTFTKSAIGISNTYLHNDILGVAYRNTKLSFMDINTQKVCSRMKLKFSTNGCLWFNGVKLIYANKSSIVVNTSTDSAEHDYKFDTEHDYKGGLAIKVEFIEDMDLFISLHNAKIKTASNRLKVWSTNE